MELALLAAAALAALAALLVARPEPRRIPVRARDRRGRL